MDLANEKVVHAQFGEGVITEVKEQKLWVQFQEEVGIKMFQYPEAFEKFLKAENLEVESSALEELKLKQEQLEREREEKERKLAELEERKPKLESQKKRATSKSVKKKASI